MEKSVQVTAADIARLAGVGRGAVSNWRRRHDDFPQPVGGTTTSPAFSLDDVKDWLGSHAEGKQLPPREWLWQDLRVGAHEDELATVIADIGSFLIYLDREPNDWTALSASDDAALAAALPKRVQAACAIPMESPPLPASLVKARMPLVREVANLAAAEGAKQTFGFLRERYFELHSKRMYGTPDPVAELMAELIGPSAEVVLDPACGSGGLLLAAHVHLAGHVSLLGQDIDEAMARLTAVHLALRTDNMKIHVGDTLRQDAFPGALVDAVVCNPPFNDRGWGYEELTADPRWEYGLPPRMESELAWVQHALAHLKPGGTAVMVMPPSAANRRSGRRIRAQLIRRGALRAAITLPLGSIPNVAVALTLWVLQRPADPLVPGQILMVDTSSKPEEFAQVARTAWNRFNRGEQVDEAGVSRSVPVIEVLDDEVDLTPARYLPVVTSTLTPELLTRRREGLELLLGSVAKLLPGTEATAADQTLPLVPVAELERRGMLTIHQQLNVRPGEVSDVPDGSTVLTAEDVVRGAPASGRTPERAVRHAIRTRRSDVVVPQIVRQPVARLVTDEDDILGTHLYLLRPDPEQLDPAFLAGFLTGTSNLRHHSSMSSNYRIDVRRAEIPLLPLTEQRSYGRAFQLLWTFAGSLRQLAELGEDVVQLTLDGLTQGVVQLPHDEPCRNEPSSSTLPRSTRKDPGEQ